VGRQVVSARDIQQASVRHYRAAAGSDVEHASSATDDQTPDTYRDRLTKYIPAEAVATYLFINTFVTTATPVRVWLLWLSFGVCTVLVPLYLRRIQKVDKVVQLIISTVAFIVWAFSIGGPFTYLPWYDPIIAVVVMALYTLAVPAIDA
jgi:hypothetical protein